MLIKNSKKIVIKLGSSTVIDNKGKFKKKINSKYEVISLFSKKDIQKVKQILIKYASR